MVNINAGTISDAVSVGRLVEKRGGHRVGVWDSPVGVPECWATLGALSQHLTSIPVGVAVTNPRTRHPVVTASALAGLAGAAPGGVFLGIGTGDSGVYNLGQRAATLRDLRAYAVCVAELLRTGRSVWRGADVHLARPPERRVPLYMAAHGRRSLELAAEIADGVFLGLGHSEDVVREVRAVVAGAAERAGRDPGSLELWWNAAGLRIGPDSERAAQEAGWLAASLAHHFARSGLAGKFVPAEYEDGVRKLGELYDLGQHGRQSPEKRRAYLEAAMELGVWDYLRERFLITGTEDEVAGRLRVLRERGVHRLELGLAAGGTDGVLAALDLVRGINAERRQR
ncbi:LLM class flavin-dependent oxidoreductase [Streptomyces sp. ODS28]|uniref:LLM class flavin-dependent oxidoreductase n=1 Tax=Streptomyces sp. ODS28 TaxID=3136688 RepID=UPI0031E9E080